MRRHVAPATPRPAPTDAKIEVPGRRSLVRMSWGALLRRNVRRSATVPRSVLNALNTLSVDTHSVPSRRSSGGIFATANSQQRPRFYQTPLVADRRLSETIRLSSSDSCQEKIQSEKRSAICDLLVEIESLTKWNLYLHKIYRCHERTFCYALKQVRRENNILARNKKLRCAPQGAHLSLFNAKPSSKA